MLQDIKTQTSHQIGKTTVTWKISIDKPSVTWTAAIPKVLPIKDCTAGCMFTFLAANHNPPTDASVAVARIRWLSCTSQKTVYAQLVRLCDCPAIYPKGLFCVWQLEYNNQFWQSGWYIMELKKGTANQDHQYRITISTNMWKACMHM